MTQLFVEGSFLRPETRKSDKDARSIGLLNKSRMMEIFWTDNFDPENLNRLCQIKVIGVYTAGMIAKKGEKYVKSSLDGVAVVEMGGLDKEIIPLEIKTRVSVSNVERAEELAKENTGSNYTFGEAVYGSCSSNEIERWIKSAHERIQLLHHAYTTGSDKALFLFGDSRRILYGVLVCFEDEVLEAYSEVLKYLYESNLEQFYQDENIMPTEEIKKILQSKSMKKKRVDMDSFKTNYGLWRCLNVVNQHDQNPVRFPLVSWWLTIFV